MRRVFLKKIIVTFIFLVLSIVLFQAEVMAKSDDIQIIKLKNNNEYIIYISGMTGKKFEFAFSNNSKANNENLVYMDSAKDEERGNNVAYIDKDIYNTYFKTNNDIYIFVKDESTEAKNIKVKLEDSLSEDDIQDLNQITKKINIEIGKKGLPTVTNKEGVRINHTIGTIKITDKKECSYSYKLIKATEGSNAKKLIKLIERLNSSNEKDIAERLSIYSELKEMYVFLKPNENDKNWQKVDNHTIEQPEDSKKGDQYLVWLKSELNNEKIVDLQVMNCEDKYVPSYEDKDITIKQISKLPITYDNVILFTLSGVLLITIIVITILKVRSRRNEK